MDTTPKPRWFRLTPDRLVIGLLVVECLLWLSARFQWLGFNQHKGWTVLIALAVVGVVFMGMLVWFVVALIFRWRFQFSFRSLLLMVVVVALPSSWLAVEMKEAKRQREVVQEIVQLQGHVAYDWEPECLVDGIVPKLPEPNWLRSYCGEDFFDDVIRFDRYSLEVEEKPEDEERILVCLSRLTKLRTLDLSNNSVKDADFAKLKGLTRLKSLTLNVCQISDASLKYLEGMQRLEYLALVGGMPNQITDVRLGLEYLQGLTRLTHLRVADVRVTDAGLKSIEGLTQLQELNFWGSEITDAGLGHLKGLTELQYLYLYDTQVTAEGEKKLQQALPNCKIWISH